MSFQRNRFRKKKAAPEGLFDEVSETKVKKKKFNNSKKKVDGIMFYSMAEAEYYKELKQEKAQGSIIDFELQPEFDVLDGFVTYSGKAYQPIRYRADFKVIVSNLRTEVIDVKGFETPDYKLKRKMFLKKFPEFYFVEIRKGKRIEY